MASTVIVLNGTDDSKGLIAPQSPEERKRELGRAMAEQQAKRDGGKTRATFGVAQDPLAAARAEILAATSDDAEDGDAR